MIACTTFQEKRCLINARANAALLAARFGLSRTWRIVAPSSTARTSNQSGGCAMALENMLQLLPFCPHGYTS